MWKQEMHYFRQLLSSNPKRKTAPAGKHLRRTLFLEALEERITPTTYTVSDLTDNVSDTGSIRYAVNQVDADSSTAADTINFASGLNGTINLGSVLTLSRTSGAINIVGPGTSLLALSGENASDIFQVNSNV